MGLGWIVLGDKTDHGGEVIEASGATDSHGKRIARVGDKVTCPKHGHGTGVIVDGDFTTTIDGQPVAIHGSKTSCGAILIASQHVTNSDMGSSAPRRTADEIALADLKSAYAAGGQRPPPAAEAETICLDCLAKAAAAGAAMVVRE